LSGALVADGKLFYSLVPPPLLYPMVLLATVATVVASQALISGAFSLGSQAIRLGLFPRLKLLHTITRIPVRSIFPSSIGRFLSDASSLSSHLAQVRRWQRRMGWPCPA
jgi:hypothetical protein